MKLKLWQKLWILFSVIWVVVAGLNVFTILAFADEAEWDKAIRPAWLALAVPAVLYFVIWGYATLRERRRPEK